MSGSGMGMGGGGIGERWLGGVGGDGWGRVALRYLEGRFDDWALLCWPFACFVQAVAEVCWCWRSVEGWRCAGNS